MQLIQVVDIDAEHYVATKAEKRFEAPAQCPHCRRAKTLWSLGYYHRNLSRRALGALRLSVRRFRCCVCRKTVSLLPAFAQPYRFVQNRTFELFARGFPFPIEVRRHLDLLSHYWRSFSRWLPELSRATGRSPPKEAREAWDALLADYTDLNQATHNLTSRYQVTLFGRYRCHRPNRSETENSEQS